MKKLLLFLCFNLLLLGAYSQTQRVETVYDKGRNRVRDIISYDEQGVITDHFMFLIGRNMKYTHIDDAVTIFKGNANQMIEFFNGLKDFSIKYKDESKMYGNVMGIKIYRDKLYGTRYNWIYSDLGYIQMNDGDFEKYIEKLRDYCKKNNIELDNIEEPIK